MIEVEQQANSIVVRTNIAELALDSGPSLNARLSFGGGRVADLVIPSSCQADGLPDFSFELTPPSFEQIGDEAVFEIASKSSIWERKTYCFRMGDEWVEYFYVVEGDGRIDTCEFFQGFVGSPRSKDASSPWSHGEPELGHWGRLRSRPFFKRIFNPEPNGLRKQLFSPTKYTTIEVRSDKGYCRGNWFFTPGPFCFAVETDARNWITLGLAAKPGEHTFTQYDCSGGNGFGLALRYEGRTHVRGRWESPHVIFASAPDEYAAVTRFCKRVRRIEYAGLVPNKKFPWWSEPIFCGWGEQCHLQNSAGVRKRAADLATQSNYERFLDALAEQGVYPGTIVVDDKWQVTYGSCEPDPAKWPDMAGFIRKQHELGRRVVLWLKAWDPEGVPPEECVLNRAECALSVDPSNPAYERRLRAQISFALGDLGADGFKIDFTSMHPPATHTRTFSNDLWGIELLKRLLWIMCDEAKRVKPDAMIIAHTANPYFADVVDVLRLNDVAIVDGEDSYADSMAHRQRIARAACPDLLIDTDNWPSPNVHSWLEYVREQPQLGIPSLYYATHVDESGEPLDEVCYAEIRSAWARYRETCSQQPLEAEVRI